MSVYFLTSSSHGLRDAMFDVESERRKTLRAPNNIFWAELKRAFETLGIEVHTFDLWNKNTAKPDDILLVMNHPGESLFWRILYGLKSLGGKGNYAQTRRTFLRDHHQAFSKRILIQIEPWVVQPYVYDNLERTRASGVYTKILLHSRGYGEQYGFFDYFQYWNRSIVSPVFEQPKTKFLTLLNGNVAPHALTYRVSGLLMWELYGERLKAIRYFSTVSGFDLYGQRWNHTVRHPLYFWYSIYAKRVWRGAPEDKSKALGPYKFALCFENCESPSWISEKIYDCFAAGCIPIYLGAPDITSYVPADCFIDFRHFARADRSFDETSYATLHTFLTSLPEGRTQEYREAIRRFLLSRTKAKGIEDFAKELLS